MKGVVVVVVVVGGGVERDEDGWESFWTEVRFDDEGDHLSNDDCDKHNDDNCDDGASF